MNYNNYGNGYGGGYRRSYGNNYGGGYGLNYSGSKRPQKKHSGCKLKMMSDGAPIISAWNYSRGAGLLAVYARPYKGTKKSESKNGNTYLNLFVTLTNKRTRQITKTSGLFCLETKKLVISDFSLVCNPTAPNGGYCGTFIRK